MQKINLRNQGRLGSIEFELLSSGAVEAITSGLIADLSYVSGAVTGAVSDLSGETSAREAADAVISGAVTGLVADVSDLDGRLDILEGGSGVVGSVEKSLADAKAYTDEKVADLVDSAPEVLDTLKELAAALGDDPAFATTIAGMIGEVSGSVASLSGDLGGETSAREAADTFLSGAVTGVVADLANETSAREAADTFISGAVTGVVADLANEVSAREAADTFLSGAVTGVVADLAAETLAREAADTFISGAVTGVVADLASETSAREAADTALGNDVAYVSGVVTGAVADIVLLDGRLDTLEGGSGVVGSVAKSLADAKEYTDQKVADLVDSAPEVLDTLKELAAALGDDPAFATTIAGQLGAVSGDIADEVSAREAADTFLSGAVTGLVADLANETSAREAADTFLSGAVTGVVADLANETSARQAADTSISGAVTGAVADLSALTSAFNAFRSSVGTFVDEETVTFNGSGEYVLAAAPSGLVSGSRPILAINGVIQELGAGALDDFQMVDDGTGVIRMVKLNEGFVLEEGDTAVIWYRAAL
jgi:uncharacterized membrane protein YoaK (UPF0700 family)